MTTKTDNQTASRTPEEAENHECSQCGRATITDCETGVLVCHVCGLEYGDVKDTAAPEAPINQDSKDIALRALIVRASELIKEMEFAFDDVPAGVDAHMALVRLSIADARQQI